MTHKIMFGIGCILLFALINTTFAAERVVLCEELYQETWSSCYPASCTLATIATNYPTRVALVEMHVVNNGSPMYLNESNYRMQYYPSPWYTPWLYRDGTSVGSGYTAWRSGIVNRMNQPSPFSQNLWGTYDPGTRTGTINATYRNDSTASVTARIYFVITEDSIYYAAANGDVWHNHVARDYLPTQIGTQVTIAPGDSATQTRNFTLNAAWNANRCQILSWIQADAPSRNTFQAGIKPVNELPTAIHEVTEIKPVSMVTTIPNPCVNHTIFSFESQPGMEYNISIFDVSGRKIRTLNGVCGSDNASAIWNCTTDLNKKVCAGVYFYHLESGELNTSGKIIVR